MLSSKNSNIKSGLKNQPTPTLDKEPKKTVKIFYYPDSLTYMAILFLICFINVRLPSITFL